MRTSEKILAVARNRGMDLKAVAEAAEIPYSTLRSYVQPDSRRLPNAPKGVALAEALRVPPGWLFDDSQDMPPPPQVEPPPFPIYPWPPEGITWEELQLAVAAYVYQKLLDRFYEISRGRGRLSLGNKEFRSIRPDRFDGMEDAPLAILDSLEAVKRAIEQAARVRAKGKPLEAKARPQAPGRKPRQK